MLKKIAFYYCLLFIILLPIQLYAEPNSKPIIKIGYVPGYGFSQTLETASARGYTFQLLERAESFSSYNFEYHPYDDGATLINALNSFEVDIIVPIMKRPSTQYNLAYSKEPIVQPHALLVKKGEDYAFYEDPKQIDGKTVASFPGSPLEPILDAYCKTHNINITYLREATLQNYFNLEADYYLISSMSNHFQNYNSVINLGKYNYYLAHRPGQEILSESILTALQDVLATSPVLEHQLYLKYYNSRLILRDLTAAEKELLTNKTFTVGYTQGHTPLLYTNAQGEADGVAVEILNILAQRYNFNVIYFPYSLNESPGDHQGYDFLISLLGDYGVERENYRITEEYFSLPLMLAAPREATLNQNFQSSKIRIGMLSGQALLHSIAWPICRLIF